MCSSDLARLTGVLCRIGPEHSIFPLVHWTVDAPPTPGLAGFSFPGKTEQTLPRRNSCRYPWWCYVDAHISGWYLSRMTQLFGRRTFLLVSPRSTWWTLHNRWYDFQSCYDQVSTIRKLDMIMFTLYLNLNTFPVFILTFLYWSSLLAIRFYYLASFHCFVQLANIIIWSLAVCIRLLSFVFQTWHLMLTA